MSAAGARDLGPAAGATASTAMEVPRSFADSALALALWLPRRALRLVELLGVFVACVIGIVLSGYGYARTVFAARRNKQAIPAEVVDATEKLRAQLASSSTRGDGPLISVVIPARNEAGHIAGTLARAETAALLPERVEVIVADAGCADNTTEVVSKLLTSFASVRVVEAESGRASALNAGAASARAPVLLFLHADTLLPEGWDVDVAANAAAPGVVAGAFSFSVNRGSFGGAEVPVGIGTMSAFANLRARMFQLPYGDQAMWMTAARFAAVGGFPPVRGADSASCIALGSD